MTQNPSVNRMPFSLRATFTVRKPFKFAGKSYKSGQPFDPKRVAVGVRRLRTMYDAKMIDMKGNAEPDEPEANEEIPAEITAEKGDFIYDPEAHTVEHEDNEYWITDAEQYLVRVRAPEARLLMEVTEKVLVIEANILAWGEDNE